VSADRAIFLTELVLVDELITMLPSAETWSVEWDGNSSLCSHKWSCLLM